MGKRIAVIGDVMLDVYGLGESQRLSPEAPVPIVLNPKTTYHLGGAAHVVKLLSSPDVEIDLYCALGDDDAGRMLQTLLEPLCKIYSTQIPVTSVKTRIKVGGHQICRIDNEVVTDVSSQILEQIIPHQDQYNAIVVSDYAKGTVSKTIALNHEAIFIDPKGTNLEFYSGSFLLKPNVKEFIKLFGFEPELNRAAQIAESLQQNSIEYLLITRSEKPAILINKTGEALEISFEFQEVNDVTGAGDVALAASVLEYINGANIVDAATLGIHRSALSVSHHGTGFANSCAIETTKKKFFSNLNDIARLKESLNEVGRKLVVTNGCFDLLHPGHLNTLKFAKSQGDYLLVLINSDDSVRQIKGENRPINSEDVRAEMLLNTPNVDGIYVFKGDTPAFEISAIIPDVLVKGGDYDPTKIVGYDLVVQNGGKVVVAPYLKGHSTSAIIEKSNKPINS